MAKKFMVVFTITTIILFTSGPALTAPQYFSDSVVVVPASLRYNNPNIFQSIFHGGNYRKIWATPIKMPVFNLATTNGGFTVKELGGGQQTKSIRIEDRKGREWVLRSVDKVVQDAALPPALRLGFVKGVVQDMISASHPYGAMVIPTIADAVKVTVAKPSIYYVPANSGLGEYAPLFAGLVCFLEEREPTPDNSDTDNTADLLGDIVEKNNNLVDQKALLRARLIDMIVSDWDRHSDQWRWGKTDSADVNLFYAIPRDRDQAFFHSNGVLVKIATMLGVPHMRGFYKRKNNYRLVNHKAWVFDQTFLNDLDRIEWQTIISDFKNALSNDVIERAVQQLPPEIYALDGSRMKMKLIEKRDRLLEDGLKYYDFVSSNVHVRGTDEKEEFEVSSVGDKILVTVYNDDNHTKIYERIFDPEVTKVIYLSGLGSKDKFNISEKNNGIKIWVDGGNEGDEVVIGNDSKAEIVKK